MEDLFHIAQEKSVIRFSSFLDMHQLSLAKQVAAFERYENYVFFGGFDQAERVMLGVFPPYEPVDLQVFPICAITACYRKEDQIGHRDILGSLMALEIKRESIGDILVTQGRSVFFLAKQAAPIALSELQKIGRCGVRLQEGIAGELPALHQYREMNCIVSSLRLDCVAAALAGVSREKSAQLIRGQAVSVNGLIRSEVSCVLEENDVISIRGTGKFIFEKQLGTTKKGRLQIICKKYI